MQKQLLLFNNAISAYFSGNQSALEATMKQFNIKPMNGNSQPTSFLERWISKVKLLYHELCYKGPLMQDFNLTPTKNTLLSKCIMLSIIYL